MLLFIISHMGYDMIISLTYNVKNYLFNRNCIMKYILLFIWVC